MVTGNRGEPATLSDMADSNATRARRYRAHHSGDHRECGARCAAVRAAVAASVPPCETVTAAVEAFGTAVGAWPADDPRRTGLALARMLAQRLDEGLADWRASEHLVSLMRSLASQPEFAADVVDEIRARGAAREIERLARTARPGA
jgi:hypothetical protein